MRFEFKVLVTVILVGVNKEKHRQFILLHARSSARSSHTVILTVNGSFLIIIDGRDGNSTQSK